MRIVLDLQGAQAASTRKRGIGRYSLAFAEALIRNRGSHEIHLLLNGAFPDSTDALRARFESLVGHDSIHAFNVLAPLADGNWTGDPRRAASEICRETFLAKLRPDIVHVSTMIEGMRENAVASIGRAGVRIPTAVTLYDLIPQSNPSAYLRGPGVEAWYSERLGQLERADLLLAISEWSATEAVRQLDIDRKRVVNVGAAADDCFDAPRVNAAERRQILSCYNIHRPFLMYTGGFDVRKNVDALVSAFADLPAAIRDSHQLVIACDCPEIEKARLLDIGRSHGLAADALVITGFIPDAHLAALYSLAKLFVFPSLEEGFGLPVLEAMRCGAPVIASNRSSMPELVELDEALFDPANVVEIRASIIAALIDDRRLAQLRDNSAIQARKFSWKDVAGRALRAFEELHKRESVAVARASSGPRPRLAFVSPIPPAQSGIAAYAEQLLPHLARLYDIDVIVADERPDVGPAKPGLAGASRIFSAREFWCRSADYDRILYHLGNSEFHDYMLPLVDAAPGVVVLHDFNLSGLVRHHAFRDVATDQAGERNWLAAIHENHGVAAVATWLQASDRTAVSATYPCCAAAIETSNATIVHSKYACRLARHWFVPGRAAQFAQVPMPCEPPPDTDRDSARQRLGIARDARLICSFGLIGPGKCNTDLLDAWTRSETARDRSCRLIFVGGGSSDAVRGLQDEIDHRQLSNRVEITGWIDASRYGDFLAACDVAVQLRRVSHGETSLTLLECLSFGIATIASASGSAAEVPERALRLLPEDFTRDVLRDAIDGLASGGAAIERMREAARDFITKEHAPGRCAELLAAEIEHAYARGAHIVEALTPYARRLPPVEVARLAQIAADATRVGTIATIALDVTDCDSTAAEALDTLRARVRQLAAQLPLEWRLKLVRFDLPSGKYFEAHGCLASVLELDRPLADDFPVEFTNCDLILLADPAILSIADRAGEIEQLRGQGVRFALVVDDVRERQAAALPVEEVTRRFEAFLNLAARADRVFCSSTSAADELRACMAGLGLSAGAVEVLPAARNGEEGELIRNLMQALSFGLAEGEAAARDESN